MGVRKIDVYTCTACDRVVPRYEVQCPSCRSYNSFTWSKQYENKVSFEAPAGGDADDGDETNVDASLDGDGPKRACDVEEEQIERVVTGSHAIDWVVSDGEDDGQGIGLGSCILVAADPGTGKTRYFSSIALRVADRGGSALVASAEMTEERMRGCLEAVGPWTKKTSRKTLIYRTTDIDAVIAYARKHRPHYVLVDSIQYFTTSTDADGNPLQARAGTTIQVSAIAKKLADLAAELNCIIVIICHMNKEGDLAGPMYAEHAVDTILYIERTGTMIVIEECPEPTEVLRLSCRGKNRFGNAGLEAFLVMGRKGRLVDVEYDKKDGKARVEGASEGE